MQFLIEDLLTYCQIKSEGASDQLIDCNQILEQVLKNLQGAIAESQAQIQLGALPTLQGDFGQMTVLFQNLISNAIKYRRCEVPLEIQIQATPLESQEWLFSISDNGIGIEPLYWNQIFEIFQRLHTAQEYPGTGIGLAICKKIVERSRGRIWVNSQLNHGTTFYFTIPSLINNGNN